MLDSWPLFWRVLITVVLGAAATAASLHAVLRRRDPRAAVLWIFLIWMLPLMGPLLYIFFGINRIERKAARLRSSRQLEPERSMKQGETVSDLGAVGRAHSHLDGLAKLVEQAVQSPLLSGNRISPLINGDEAYPAMIQAIDEARSSIGLSTYIFNHDRIGKEFIEALVRAAKRNVDVRVLIDDIGSGFSWSSVYRALHNQKIPVAYFLTSLLPWRMAYLNLRNHRKILTVDGRLGFTGGINIHESHHLGLNPKHPTQDIHFKIEGPVVAQMQEVFRVDWYFTTDEVLSGEKWFPRLLPVGDVLARAIPDGPDEDFEKTRWTILAALARARSSVRIVTPYLIPDLALISALNVAAMSGVVVDICLPQHTDMKLVQWATKAVLWQILERGCRVWLTPAPFDHSKLMVVDGVWALIGSTNWDPRSLRLNFEFNVECYNEAFASQLDSIIESKIKLAAPVTLIDVDSRPYPIKLRDGISRLFSPLL